ncbi:MAG: manganese catalase family protein [Bacilli bacterium]|jgi:spore coat protein JC|nr:manganese catalase family protein [Bacilli bacterium]HHU24239.1 manganese catalase family protein [Acholeplasmataceae bacterium]
MWIYEKKLQYPVNITKRDLPMAKNILTQYGGPQGELAAAIRYLNQRYTMPDDYGKALLTDIGTEELAHVEVIAAMVYQLTKGATKEEIIAAGLGPYYSNHGLDLFPENSSGEPFTTAYISAVGDPIANIEENMAAEQKARAVYENLINLATSDEVIQPLLFLRQREIIHYHRFAELLQRYQEMGLK